MKKDKLIYIPVGILTSVTALSGAVLSGGFTHAVEIQGVACEGVANCVTTPTNSPVTATVSVADACTLTTPPDPSTDTPYAYNVTVDVSNGSTWVSTDSTSGGYKDQEKYTMTATCNDVNGFSIVAVGYGPATAGGAAAAGNTALVGTSGSIATGPATTGSTSNWAFKVSLPEDDADRNVGANSGIQGGYQNYSAVPGGSGAEIFRATGATTGKTQASFTTDYQVYVSASQPAGTYTGGVKYSLVHPNSGA